MIYTINNGKIALSVSSLGGEMQSLQLCGKEVLWQGDRRYWKGRATNLFPYIARLTNQTYTYRGKPYHMEIHGFIKDSELSCEQPAQNTLCFTMQASAQTLEQYPFLFEYQIRYRIEGQRVTIVYHVKNTGDEAMYFGIGGHPGFQVPLDEGLNFTDYYLEFSEKCEPQRVLFSPQYFVQGQTDYPIVQERYLPLSHRLFDEDAVVLSGVPGEITLKSSKGRTAIKVGSPAFDYLGLWHTPKADAPFLCIEPWSSLPSRQGIVEELTQQQDLLVLQGGEEYNNEWFIEVTG